MIDGLINLHKPTGITSARALYRVRRIVGERKSGHTGTLDPGASGVLLLCLGRATKLVERIMDLPKVYRATARLDVTSDSFDAEAEIRSFPCPTIPTAPDVVRVLHEFVGDLAQVPPALSAIKVGGVAACRRARRGELIDLKPRIARIYSIRLERFEWPVVQFELCCGRGTYVRALVRDLGQRLNTGGCLTALSRTRIGPFTLDESWTFDALEQSPGREYIISPAEAMERIEPTDPSNHP